MTRSIPDLACRELVEIVTDYLEDRMSAEDRTRFELHLAVCDPCRTYLAQMREVVAAAGKVSEEALAPKARDELLRAFRGWKVGKPGGSA